MSTIIDRIRAFGVECWRDGKTGSPWPTEMTETLILDIEDGINLITVERAAWKREYESIIELRDALILQSDQLALKLTQTRTDCDNRLRDQWDTIVILRDGLRTLATHDNSQEAQYACQVLSRVDMLPYQEGEDR